MRRPGGFGQIFGPYDMKLVGTDEYGREIPQECDTFTCGHCQRIVFVKPKERPEDIGGMCYGCTRLICPQCTNIRVCDPIEERIEAAINKKDFSRWLSEANK